MSEQPDIIELRIFPSQIPNADYRAGILLKVQKVLDQMLVECGGEREPDRKIGTLFFNEVDYSLPKHKRQEKEEERDKKYVRFKGKWMGLDDYFAMANLPDLQRSKAIRWVQDYYGRGFEAEEFLDSVVATGNTVNEYCEDGKWKYCGEGYEPPEVEAERERIASEKAEAEKAKKVAEDEAQKVAAAHKEAAEATAKDKCESDEKRKSDEQIRITKEIGNALDWEKSQKVEREKQSPELEKLRAEQLKTIIDNYNKEMDLLNAREKLQTALKTEARKQINLRRQGESVWREYLKDACRVEESRAPLSDVCSVTVVQEPDVNPDYVPTEPLSRKNAWRESHLKTSVQIRIKNSRYDTVDEAVEDLINTYGNSTIRDRIDMETAEWFITDSIERGLLKQTRLGKWEGRNYGGDYGEA